MQVAILHKLVDQNLLQEYTQSITRCKTATDGE
jgi:hypothetical protein